MLTNREKLFWIQTTIGFLSLILLIFIFPTQGEFNVLKTVIAPFASITLLLFLLFIINKVIKNFPETAYSLIQIILSLALVVATAGAMHTLISIISEAMVLDKILFYISILIGLVILLVLRIRNIWSMAIITGMIQGILTYILFIMDINTLLL